VFNFSPQLLKNGTCYQSNRFICLKLVKFSLFNISLCNLMMSNKRQSWTQNQALNKYDLLEIKVYLNPVLYQWHVNLVWCISSIFPRILKMFTDCLWWIGSVFLTLSFSWNEKPHEDKLKISLWRRYKYLRQGRCVLSCTALQYTMKSLALILGLLAAVQLCNCNIQLCTAVMFGLAVEIINICGSALQV
jgi:hypothetical protein